MIELANNIQLELQYRKGFGAWTYHLVIPNTAHISGKWGDLKVSGFIDDYKIDFINLAPRKGDDKIISINKDIRKTLGKTDGDLVIVTLYLHSKQEHLNTKASVIECFKDAGVLEIFHAKKNIEQQQIIEGIMLQSSEKKQIDEVNRYIKLWSS